MFWFSIFRKHVIVRYIATHSIWYTIYTANTSDRTVCFSCRCVGPPFRRTRDTISLAMAGVRPTRRSWYRSTPPPTNRGTPTSASACTRVTRTQVDIVYVNELTFRRYLYKHDCLFTNARCTVIHCNTFVSFFVKFSDYCFSLLYHSINVILWYHFK